MDNYLSSCHKLRELKLKIIVPAHGPINKDPEALLSMYIAHRLGETMVFCVFLFHEQKHRAGKADSRVRKTRIDDAAANR